jgi:hypothetical protein
VHGSNTRDSLSNPTGGLWQRCSTYTKGSFTETTKTFPASLSLGELM